MVKIGTITAIDPSRPDSFEIHVDGAYSLRIASGPIVYWSPVHRDFEVLGVIDRAGISPAEVQRLSRRTFSTTTHRTRSSISRGDIVHPQAQSTGEGRHMILGYITFPENGRALPPKSPRRAHALSQNTKVSNSPIRGVSLENHDDLGAGTNTITFMPSKVKGQASRRRCGISPSV
jgi:hypothetical protein